jgi:ABC-2 type transport system permease protein
MKTTLRIAKLELSTLFFSPIAWFLLIVFLFQCGLAYTGGIETYVTYQELGGQYLQYLTFLTLKVFGPPYGMFPTIIGKLYLYLPLLTMGLMSREISSGTIKLLYSSPVRIREIIFGKFLAMMVYNLLLILILAIFAGTGILNIKGADCTLLLSGFLGMYLLLCAYAAIGLFMSCLTSYQVVAALSTLVVLAALSYIGTVWQDIDFVRDLTYFLSISGRAENMLGGLISTKDVLYFAVIIYIFLGLSIYKLQAGRESKPALVKAGRYALIVVSALVIGYVTSRPGLIGYCDATATKTRTLTPNTQKIIRETGDEPLEVTSYINLLDQRYWYGQPSQRNEDMARWEPYLRFKPDIRFKYVYFYDSVETKWLYKAYPGLSVKGIAEKYAKTFKVDLDGFKTPQEIRKVIDLRPEQDRYVMQLRYKGQTTFLRLFDDPMVFPGETETSAALKRLMVKLPKIAFLQGELERSPNKMGDRDYKVLTSQITFRYALVNQGFDVETVSLKAGDTSSGMKGGEIPPDIAALVIADPKTDFDPSTLAKIRQYIAAGGNLLIAGEPGKQSVLNPLLQPLGVQLMNGVLVQPSKEFAPDLVLPYLTDTAAALSKLLEQDFEDSLRISMPGVAGLSYTSNGTYDIRPLLMTDGSLTWNKKGRLVADSADVVYSAADGDGKGAVPTALRLTRNVNGREQRIIITGDADFLSNTELERGNVKTANFHFNTALFGWFTYGQFPIDATRPKSRDTRFSLTGSGITRLKVVFLGILPGLLLILASVLLIRRKRK